MHQNVESILEETLSLLKRARELKLLAPKEVRTIVKKRRDLEYSILSPSCTRKNFLDYAVFEKDLTTLLKRRLNKRKESFLHVEASSSTTKNNNKKANKKKNKLKQAQSIIGQISSRIILIYSRAVRKFPSDSKLWIHYAQHCISNGMPKITSRVLMKAIALCGYSPDIWIMAMSFHFDHCADARTARAIAQRALRMHPKNITLWIQYFRMELFYLARLTTRRFAMGLVPGENDDTEKQQTTNNDERDEDEQKDSDMNQKTQNNNNTNANASLDTDDMNIDSSTVDVEQTNKDKDEDADMTEINTAVENEEEEEEEEEEEATAVVEDDNASTKKSPKKLSFWTGGVPLAVLKAACKKATLSDLDCAQFYNIACTCPLTPAELYLEMANVFQGTFPQRAIVQFLTVRAVWDAAKARYDRNVASAKRGLSGSVETTENMQIEDQLGDEKNKLIQSGVNVMSSITLKLLSLSSSSASISEKEKDDDGNVDLNALESNLENFSRQMKSISKSHEELNDAIDQLNVCMDTMKKSRTDNDLVTKCQSGTQQWDSKTLCQYLQRGYDEFNVTHTDLLACVRRICLKPFRNTDEDRALCLYIETRAVVSKVELNEIFNFLISQPPLTMVSLMALTKAIITLINQTSDDDVEKLKQNARKSFTKASGLKDVHKNIDFWLQYIDFERRIKKDAKEASVVHAKALRVLDETLRENFVERLSLLSLR